MRLYLVGLIIWGGCFYSLYAQDVNFSQFHNAPVQNNPGMIGMSNQTQVIFNYRTQFIGGGNAYETPMVSVIYPWIKGGVSRPMAFGASFLQDRTGENGILRTTGALLTAAYNLNLNPTAPGDSSQLYHKYISVGIQGGFFQRAIDINALTSSSQWDGSVFDGGLPIGENLDLLNASKSFPMVNVGAVFYMANACGDTKAYIGANVQNLNQPDIGFFAASQLVSPQLTITGGYSFDIQDKFSIQPNLRWIQVGNTKQIRGGSLLYYNFFGGTGMFSEGKIGVGAWYDSNNSVALAMEVNQNNYFVGFSYDMGATEKVNSAGLGSGAWELSLGIKFGKKCREDRKPKEEPIRDTTYLEVKGMEGDSVYTIVATIEGQEVMSTDTVDVKYVPHEEDGDLLIPTEEDLMVFKKKAFFYYISDDINKASSALLNQMAETMTKFKGIKVKILGHTCNIGGSEPENQELSIRRSTAVRKYLVNKGVAEDRLEMEGFGSSEPILSNKTEYGRIKNRRVEFEVVATGE